jgi:hypothetical protein
LYLYSVGSYPSLMAVCGGDVDHTVTYSGEISHTMTPTAVADWLATLEGGAACAAAPKTPKSGVTLDATLDYSKAGTYHLLTIVHFISLN